MCDAEHRLYLFDMIDDGTQCPNCGGWLWIVDGDGTGDYWFLCVGYKDASCIETRPIPDNIEIVKE